MKAVHYGNIRLPPLTLIRGVSEKNEDTRAVTDLLKTQLSINADSEVLSCRHLGLPARYPRPIFISLKIFKLKRGILSSATSLRNYVSPDK